MWWKYSDQQPSSVSSKSNPLVRERIRDVHEPLAEAKCAGGRHGLLGKVARLATYQLLIGHAVGLISISTLPPPEVRIILLEVPLELGEKRICHAFRSMETNIAHTLTRHS